ncbi:hypothetical protein ACW2QC_09185 [Virgibacillus sp. FSP13]
MNDNIKKRMEQLASINNKIKQLDQNELSHLYELVSLHNEALFIVGDLVSEALYVKDDAYLQRKHIHAETVNNGTGTVASREAKAELSVYELRKAERDANSMHSKYKHRYDAINHRLIDLRQKRNKLEDELKTINDRQG